MKFRPRLEPVTLSRARVDCGRDKRFTTRCKYSRTFNFYDFPAGPFAKCRDFEYQLPKDDRLIKLD